MPNLLGLRVCMLTSAHKPDDDRIFYKEARSLAKAGADVVVMCAYDKGIPENDGGVNFIKHGGGGTLTRRVCTINKLEASISSYDFDVVHCHEPDALVAALRVKKNSRVKVIFDSHESWSAVFAGKFPKPFWNVAQYAYSLLERRLVHDCDGAIGASWAISEYLSSIIPGRPVANILNVPVVEVFGAPIDRTWNETTFICHDGHLKFNRGLRTMAQATRLLVQNHGHDVVFKIVGDVFGEEKIWLEDYIRKNSLQNFVFRTGDRKSVV